MAVYILWYCMLQAARMVYNQESVYVSQHGVD